MTVDLAALHASGELQTLARQTVSVAAFATKLGLTTAALTKRLQRAGLPSWLEMHSGAATGRPPPQSFDVDVSDFDGEERTTPGAPAFDTSDVGHVHNDNCTYEVGGRYSCEYAPNPVIPAGHFERGRSTLVDGDGNVRLTWHKTTVSNEQRLENLVAAVTDPETWSAIERPAEQPPPSHSDADLMAVYLLGDPHIGSLAWEAEVGEDFDLKIAERDMTAAVDHLVRLADPAALGVVVSLGDYFHVDSDAGTTTKGTRQDCDSRWTKMLQVGIRAMRHCIESALRKHALVRVVCIIGNHDRHASAVLAIALAQAYENNPRVEVDTSPDPFHWVRFGRCLLGITHGDEAKPDKLPGVMACDRAADWGETTYRAWLCGHVHHSSVKEYPGVTVETFPTLAARDRWHHGAGYRSQRSMVVDTYHKEWGPIRRSTVGVRQIRGAA